MLTSCKSTRTEPVLPRRPCCSASVSLSVCSCSVSVAVSDADAGATEFLFGLSLGLPLLKLLDKVDSTYTRRKVRHVVRVALFSASCANKNTPPLLVLSVGSARYCDCGQRWLGY